MTKKKSKKGAAKKGAAKGVSSDAAGSSAMEVDAIVSHEELQTLKALGLNLENLEAIGLNLEDIGLAPQKVVEVVYVESSLKRTESVSRGEPLTQDWLRRCARDSYEEWRDRDHLPQTVQPDHLVARVVPEAAGSASDVAVGKGLVIVELKEDHMEEGLVGQLALASGNALTSEGTNRALMDANQTLMQQLATERDAVRQEFAAELERQLDVFRRDVQEQDTKIEEQDTKIEAQQTKIEVLCDQLQQLRAFAKKGLKLSNKVKKRVALALARTAVEKAVGKAKDDNVSWSKYISELSPAQWSTVGWSKAGASKKLVKDLLADGAHDLNDSIHSMPPEEVVGSIAGMQHGPPRTAWEEIFFLAFQRLVSDDVFAEHVDYAAREEEMLGGEQPEEMLKEKGVAPFSKWEKELPKIIFDPRFKAIPSHTERRSIFEHYVRTRADVERREKRAAQKAAIEGFKQLLEEASKDISHSTTYDNFAKRWGEDPRFEALERKDRESLLNERVGPLRKAEEEKVRAERAAAVAGFRSLLSEMGEIGSTSRWSKVKENIRSDPRYQLVQREEREELFDAIIAELRAAELEVERAAKVKKEEEDKLREKEREARKRKEREEQELERVRVKARRKDAATAFQALMTEKIKDPEMSWTEARSKLEKDSLGRASNPDIDASEKERIFRAHIDGLYSRCVRDFRALLSDLITPDTAAKHNEEGKNALHSYHEAKKLIRADSRYSKMPRRERESLWRKHADDVQRRMKVTNSSSREDNHISASGRALSPSRVSSDHRSRSPGRRSSPARRSPPVRRSPSRRSPARRSRR